MAENNNQERVINKDITVIAIERKLNEKINKMCEKHNMSRDFFITKALENYVKYLAKKKVTGNKEEEK